MAHYLEVTGERFCLLIDPAEIQVLELVKETEQESKLYLTLKGQTQQAIIAVSNDREPTSLYEAWKRHLMNRGLT